MHQRRALYLGRSIWKGCPLGPSLSFFSLLRPWAFQQAMEMFCTAYGVWIYSHKSHDSWTGPSLRQPSPRDCTVYYLRSQVGFDITSRLHRLLLELGRSFSFWAPLNSLAKVLLATMWYITTCWVFLVLTRQSRAYSNSSSHRDPFAPRLNGPSQRFACQAWAGILRTGWLAAFWRLESSSSFQPVLTSVLDNPHTDPDTTRAHGGYTCLETLDARPA